jgi:hypothetical protein
MGITPNGKNYICEKYGNTSSCIVSSGIIFDFTDTSNIPYTNQTAGTPDVVDYIAWGLMNTITLRTPPRPQIIDPKGNLDSANGSIVTDADAVSLYNHVENGASGQWCYGQQQSGETVRCYLCSGNQAYYYDFPTGTICGQGAASGFPYTVEPVCLSGGASSGGCHAPNGASGTYTCFGKNWFQCDGTHWQKIEENSTHCGQCACTTYLTQSGCESAVSEAGVRCCYWYQKYFWESPSCHDQPQDYLRDYMPFIVGGLGIAILLVLLAGGKKGQKIMMLPRSGKGRGGGY